MAALCVILELWASLVVELVMVIRVDELCSMKDKNRCKGYFLLFKHLVMVHL